MHKSAITHSNMVLPMKFYGIIIEARCNRLHIVLCMYSFFLYAPLMPVVGETERNIKFIYVYHSIVYLYYITLHYIRVDSCVFVCV